MRERLLGVLMLLLLAAACAFGAVFGVTVQ